MKSSKFFLIIPAVVIVTLLSIYITSNAETYAFKSVSIIYAYSDSTQIHDACCKSMESCGDMKSSSNHDGMMNHDEMMMNHEKQEDDKNAGEHKHSSDKDDTKKDDHSGCMGH
jgi:hypothetical protein